MTDSNDTPVYKITIQRDSPLKGSEPKFTLVPENFTMTSQAAPLVPRVQETPPVVVCTSVANTPVFSSGTYMKCAVPDCNNYFDGQRSEFMGISYFPFPQDPELRLEWIRAIDLPPGKDPDQMKVCSDHFMNKDFVSDFIEIEDDAEEASHPKKAKSQENVELKPGVKPSVKLGQAEKMAEFAKETWEKYVRTYSDKSKKGGGKLGKFAGLDNPLMDTENELRSSVNVPLTSSTPVQSAPSVEEPSTVDSVVPVITSVGTIHSVTIMDDPSSSEVSAGNKSQKDIVRERADTLGTLVDVVEVDDDEDDEIEEELLAKKLGWQTQKTTDNVNRLPDKEEENEMEQGLINVPASVKFPPRKTITGDSSTNAPSKAPEPVPSSSRDGATFPSTSDDAMPSTSSWPPDLPIPQQRTRRKRRTREEMRRREEEDEWEPTFWSKKTLVKEGYEFEPKRRGQPQKVIRASKDVDMSDDEEALLEDFDEGFRIDEPIATRSQSSPEKRRRPGPASKTSRPQYVPPTSDQPDVDLQGPTSENCPKNGVVEKDLEEVLADKSLLVDWAFFKSLVPDLGKMSVEKRDELKTFMLDTLNARIYEGKPILPNYRGPVAT